MKLYFDTQAEAQAKADAIHAWMIANRPAYAASVASGQTLRWAVPSRDVDEDGKPIGTQWYVGTKARCIGALTTLERDRLK